MPKPKLVSIEAEENVLDSAADSTTHEGRGSRNLVFGIVFGWFHLGNQLKTSHEIPCPERIRERPGTSKPDHLYRLATQELKSRFLQEL